VSEVVEVGEAWAITFDGVVVEVGGTVNEEELASCPDNTLRCEAALAAVVDGMAAGTPTATAAAAATVPARMALDRPSGRGASPMSHWVHCFMDCNQLFIVEPLRT
jgi:hypothetical protein